MTLQQKFGTGFLIFLKFDTKLQSHRVKFLCKMRNLLFRFMIVYNNVMSNLCNPITGVCLWCTLPLLFQLNQWVKWQVASCASTPRWRYSQGTQSPSASTTTTTQGWEKFYWICRTSGWLLSKLCICTSLIYIL